MKVEKLPDGQIKMSSGAWSDTFPQSKLESWINWYDLMHSDYGHSKYKQSADELRALA
jgi:hypothetical protein